MPTTTKRFAPRVLAAIRDGKFLAIRAGEDHRFIRIWAVVVDGRVFVRSWTIKPNGWYRTFRENPAGAIQIGDREILVRARPLRGQRLNAAIDTAYLEKFPSKGWRPFAAGLAEPARRATTTELLPR